MKPIMFNICGLGNPNHAEPPPISQKQWKEAVKAIKRELKRWPKWKRTARSSHDARET